MLELVGRQKYASILQVAPLIALSLEIEKAMAQKISTRKMLPMLFLLPHFYGLDLMKKKLSVIGFCSGAVAGLVAIPPGSDYVGMPAALAFGFLGSVSAI
ncbi:hypothetical protein G9A89_020110 [Geosiphon pyriformis]|nr:hypothetical protein G9A89_020110 [Geosiphon pyriformis]